MLKSSELAGGMIILAVLSLSTVIYVTLRGTAGEGHDTNRHHQVIHQTTSANIPPSADLIDAIPTVDQPTITFLATPETPQTSTAGTSGPPKLSCPKWEPMQPSALRNLDLYAHHCQDLSSRVVNTTGGNKDFMVSLCMSDTVCGLGYVQIEAWSIDKQNDCKADINKRIISSSPVTQKWIKDNYGPDFFYLSLTGPQREVSSEWVHMGSCRYKLPFQLYSPGNYHLSLTQIYDRYSALDETLTTNPKNINRKLLEMPITVDCPGCPKYTPKSVDDMAKTLPVCPRQGPNHGVYLKMTNQTQREQQRREYFKVSYIWTPVGCTYDQRFDGGIPDSCLITAKTADSQMRNRRVMLVGDSQVGVTWTAMDQRLAGKIGSLLVTNGVEMANSYTTSKPHHSWSIDGNQGEPTHPLDPNTKGVWIKYKPESHLHPFLTYQDHSHEIGWDVKSAIDRFVDEADVMVFGSGYWPVGGNTFGGDVRISRWKAFLEFATETMLEAGYKRSKLKMKPVSFGWHGVMSRPFSPNEPDGVLDWRNYVRMRAWNQLAAEIIRDKGFNIEVSADRISLPWIHDSVDGTHFHATPAVDAVVDELLHQLNLCGH